MKKKESSEFWFLQKVFYSQEYNEDLSWTSSVWIGIPTHIEFITNYPFDLNKKTK